jgi:hypothetical protein
MYLPLRKKADSSCPLPFAAKLGSSVTIGTNWNVTWSRAQGESQDYSGKTTPPMGRNLRGAASKRGSGEVVQAASLPKLSSTRAPVRPRRACRGSQIRRPGFVPGRSCRERRQVRGPPRGPVGQLLLSDLPAGRSSSGAAGGPSRRRRCAVQQE